jgi:hypothetical protein
MHPPVGGLASTMLALPSRLERLWMHSLLNPLLLLYFILMRLDLSLKRRDLCFSRL